MNISTKNRRKNYFIDKGFQSRFIIKFCMLVILTSVLTGVLMYAFNQGSTTVAFDNLRVVVKTTADFIMPMILVILAVVTLLISISTILVTLFTSHHISGPLYKLMMELEKIKSGDLRNPIRIRAKDNLQKVANEFDEMRVEMKASIAEIKYNWDAVKGAVSSNGTQGKEIDKNIAKLESELSKFKI